jgi:hypothetical protein
MYLQSIKSVKHNAAKSVNRSVLKKSRHIGFGVIRPWVRQIKLICTLCIFLMVSLLGPILLRFIFGC